MLDRPNVLFDHEADPNETTNLADDPASADGMDEFQERQAELGIGPGKG
jgi:hypothetical protein